MTSQTAEPVPLVLFILLIILPVSSFASSTGDKQASRFPTDAVLVIAHRGSSDNYPENTILAFDKAFEEGAHGIELDVRSSADGELIVIHDQSVDRTTGHSGNVASFTAAELTAMDAGSWRGEAFANRPDTRIPTLAQVLDRYRGRPVFITVQIKGDSNEIRQAFREIDSRDMLGQCFIFSNRNRIGALKAASPKAMIVNDGMAVGGAELLQLALPQRWDAISTGLNKMEKAWIDQAHSNGILVQASFITGDYRNTTHHLLELGVNFLLGNNPKAMADAVAAQGRQQITPQHTAAGNQH